MITAAYGALGGLVRAIVGLMKSKKRGETFHPPYMLFTLVGSAIIGIAAGLLITGEARLAILAGYAGTDFIEGMVKLR